MRRQIPGQAHRCGSADGFKKDIQGVGIGNRGKQDRRYKHNGKGHHGNSHSLVNSLLGNIPVEQRNILLILDGCQCGYCQYSHGNRFDTACGAHRRTADKHEQQAKNGRSVGQVLLRDGCKTGGSGGDRLEQRNLELIEGGQIANGQRIIILKQKDQYCTPKNQNQRCDNGDFAVQGEISETFVFLSGGSASKAHHIPPHNISDASQDDQQAGDGVNEGIGSIVAQAVFCNDINTGIAKGGDGCKYRYPDTPWAKFRNEYDHVKQCADSLCQESSQKHPLDESHNAGKAVQVKGVLQQEPVTDTHSLVQQDHQRGRNRDHTQTTHLDQNQNDRLAESTPCGYRGQCYKSCYAGSGCCGKQGIQVSNGVAAGRTDRQSQQQASQKDHHQETQHDHMCCGEGNILFYHKQYPYHSSQILVPAYPAIIPKKAQGNQRPLQSAGSLAFLSLFVLYPIVNFQSRFLM